MHGDPRRHARERRECQQPRQAEHDPGTCDRGERAEEPGRSEQPVMPLRCEVGDQEPGADRPRGKAGDAQVTAVRYEQQGEADRTERSGELRGAVGHTTTTVVTAEWPAAVT